MRAIAPACFQEIFVNLRSISKLLALLAALATWPGAYAQAQTQPSSSPAATPASAATSSAPEFRSAFEGYQPYTEEKTLSWKDANDSVGRIGGWRVYAKEAQQVQQAPAAAGVANQPDPHAGHAMPPKDKKP
ncbi:hypothetical protein [Polaromonas sp.]|uniref:hypothetical protein n=1 Tax=Polaromonas sp. TaxID=1869339 RepID=UPI00375123EB